MPLACLLCAAGFGCVGTPAAPAQPNAPDCYARAALAPQKSIRLEAFCTRFTNMEIGSISFTERGSDKPPPVSLAGAFTGVSCQRVRSGTARCANASGSADLSGQMISGLISARRSRCRVRATFTFTSRPVCAPDTPCPQYILLFQLQTGRPAGCG